ncbi:MAG: hypothetical protein GW778_04100 [Alphaproteobacteria bacterium]|nr:hypothetical protein [Alphaproteobacteria bacterium]
MMRLCFAVVVFSVWVFPAMAQQGVDSVCERLSQFVPIDGVEFQPGATDVPVNINSIQDPVHGSISIPVDVNLAEYFDRPELRSVPGLMLEPEIANIEINQDGSVFYNGQEISADIKRICGGDVNIDKLDAIISKVTAPVVSEPPPKPSFKPVQSTMEQKKKSSVKVMSGDETVISTEAVDRVQKDVKLKPQSVPVKEEAVDENGIDVEVLKAQDSTDGVINSDSEDESILEGQYP